MASDRAKWSKDEVNALIDAYSDAKTSATIMSTNQRITALPSGLFTQIRRGVVFCERQNCI